MNGVAIRVERLGKRYRIGQQAPRYRSLRESLAETLAGKFNPRRRSETPRNGDIWALRDVSFNVPRGQVLGVIGRNGAGKTTLLKVLSRITEPTVGEAEVHGRVGSLLEVGTGFHPELTGRENIYLNGAILGMTRREIDRKFDEIVAFAGVERFIDTPIKRYSTGMQVRLAFAVAAHLELEVMFVDEVLSVGDAEFQRRCLDRMRQVTREGRTVVLVSHDMGAIRNLSDRVLLIDQGSIVVDGDPSATVAQYLRRNEPHAGFVDAAELSRQMTGYIVRDQPFIRCERVEVRDASGVPRSAFRSDEEIHVGVTYRCLRPVADLRVNVWVVDENSRPLLVTQTIDDPNAIAWSRCEPGMYESTCVIPARTFGERAIELTIELEIVKTEHLIYERTVRFNVEFVAYNGIVHSNWSEIPFRPRFLWRTRALGPTTTVNSS